MALCTQIMRDGKPRKVRWSWWHVECMTQAAIHESGQPEDTPILDAWSLPALHNGIKCERAHTFTDPRDGEVFVILPGDTLAVWRDR